MTSIVLRILAWVLIAGAAAGWHGLDCGLETSRVGQCVLTEVSVTGPGAPPAVSGEPDQTAVDPATWRVVSLRMPNDSHAGTYYEMELLQPAGWFARSGAAVGRWIDLSLPELQISGMAQVTAVKPCPPIEGGYGRVVLGTFTSVSSDVYELKLAGQDQALGVTSGHPIWSLDRGAWIAAGALRPGERPATAAGEAVVEYVAVQPGERRVYNLNVEGDHRYLVGGPGLVAHNAGECEFFADPKDALGPGGQDAVMVPRSEVKVKDPVYIARGFKKRRIYKMPWGEFRRVFYMPGRGWGFAGESSHQ